MADQPRRGDDDEATPSEVTVPPWLRTGPTPEQSAAAPESAPAAASDSARAPTPDDGRGDEVPGRAGTGPQGPSREITPNRIRLGRGGRADEPAREPTARPDAERSGRRARDLSSLPLGADRSVSERAVGAGPEPTASPTHGGRARRLGVFAAAGVAVLVGSAVVGFLLARGALSPTGEEAADCVPVSEPGRVVGDGPGSLDSPLETVLAFDHAYYVERSAEKAFEAVSPSSRMAPDRLHADGVDRVREGTTHCVDARELSPTLLEVRLTESAPDSEPVVMRQRVRVAENPDGTWGIVSITPAG
ncbi:hypothetical protein [Dietzia sp. 2505]|uniref:hypothetical protein n=1 Tax=Dietzia sp. 2505 TaxID=3156457 RepID=UPI00339B1290